jgi:plastocyanin
MYRSAWKNRVTLGLGVGIATVALIAGCSDDEEDGDDIGIDPTSTTTATETMTETSTPSETATETMTETPSTTSEAGEDVAVDITADGLMLDGVVSDDLMLTAGSTVTFTNDGEETIHLMTDDGAIDEEIEAGATFEYTFDEAGTWTVSVDDEEMGTITVS